MRRWLYIALLHVGACTEEVGDPRDACEIGAEVQREAMAEASEASIPCERDDDCTLMAPTVSCPAYQSGSCPRAVHLRVAQAYAALEVQDRVCDATRDAELGCSLNPSCAAVGAAVCEAGQCVTSEGF